MLAKHALSQLSYGPFNRAITQHPMRVVGRGGLEPPTSRLSGVRSNRLSYQPVPFVFNQKEKRSRRCLASQVWCHPIPIDPSTVTKARGRLTTIRGQARAQSLKGGDPAAGSPTATLLRLHPSR